MLLLTACVPAWSIFFSIKLSSDAVSTFSIIFSVLSINPYETFNFSKRSAKVFFADESFLWRFVELPSYLSLRKVMSSLMDWS